ncbi:MAG TPA: response regulator [Blastocatellia bacterium]|nr:response regulator [Blastocatellia bacterium]
MTEHLRRILIAEDDDEQRTALKLILKLSKFAVIEARDGHEAIESVRREHPDLVLMDLSLPVVDGLEATRELRHDAAFQHLPIIFVTGYDQQETIDNIKACGGTDFISKPIEFDELKKMIDKHLSN